MAISQTGVAYPKWAEQQRSLGNPSSYQDWRTAERTLPVSAYTPPIVPSQASYSPTELQAEAPSGTSTAIPVTPDMSKLAALSSPNALLSEVKKRLMAAKATTIDPLEKRSADIRAQLMTTGDRTLDRLGSENLERYRISRDMETNLLRSQLADAEARIESRQRSIDSMAQNLSAGTSELFQSLIAQQQQDVENKNRIREIEMQEDQNKMNKWATIADIQLKTPAGKKLSDLGLTGAEGSRVGLNAPGTESGGGVQFIADSVFGGFTAVDKATGAPLYKMDAEGNVTPFAGTPEIDTSASTGPGTSKVGDYSMIFYGSSKNGAGLDLAGPYNSPITASNGGTVIFAGTNGGWGNQVKIQGDDGNVYQYSHLASISPFVKEAVGKGTRIEEGTFLGGRGNTGSVMGANGETLTPEQIAQGRGTHLDYTVYKPDGTTYTPQEAAQFAGIHTQVSHPSYIASTTSITQPMTEQYTEQQVIGLATKAGITDPKEQAGILNSWRQSGQIPDKILPEKKAEQEAISVKTKNELVLGLIDEILADPYLPLSVGMVGYLGQYIAGTPAYNISKNLDTIKANIAFDELIRMREASKTGGALGQVSDREGQLLQSVLGSVDQGQGLEQFKKNLLKIKNSITRINNAVDSTFENYPGWNENQQTPQNTGTVRVVYPDGLIYEMTAEDAKTAVEQDGAQYQ